MTTHTDNYTYSILANAAYINLDDEVINIQGSESKCSN